MRNKKSFIAYVDWGETFDALPDDKAGQLVKHLFAYVNDKNPVTDDILINAVFTNIKLQLKRDLKKWEDISVQRTEIGRLGGIKSGEARQSKSKQTKQLVKKRSKTKQNEHDTVTVTVTDNVTENITEDINPIDIAWLKWKKYKKDEFKFNYKSEISEQAAKAELINLSDNNAEIALKIIEQSIAKGWKGFFKLVENGKNRKSNNETSNAELATLLARKFGVDSSKGN